MFRFEDLTIENFLEIAEYIDAQDLINLSHCNSFLFQQFKEDLLWNSQLELYRVTQDTVLDLLQECSIVNESLLKLLRPLEGNCKGIVFNIAKIEREEANEINHMEPEMIEEIREILVKFRSNQEINTLHKAIAKAYNAIVFYPSYSLYMLAFSTFILNYPHISLNLIELGLNFDEQFGPLLELKEEVNEVLKDLGGQEQVPLAINNELSSNMKKVVKNIFQRYTMPGTRKIDLHGLERFITVTNKGSIPPKEFVHHVFNNFSDGNGRQAGITLDGFELFYLNIALSDPKETRNDLLQHGFNPRTLLPIE